MLVASVQKKVLRIQNKMEWTVRFHLATEGIKLDFSPLKAYTIDKRNHK